jgi:hypothetical protein
MSVWKTKEGRRAVTLATLLKWPLLGALIAGGALGAVRAFGPKVATNLGLQAGEGFARGVARVQQLASVSGARGWYR